MNKNKILSGGGKNLTGGGKWAWRGREEGGEKWGERGREVGIGYPLSTPSYTAHNTQFVMFETPFTKIHYQKAHENMNTPAPKGHHS